MTAGGPYSARRNSYEAYPPHPRGNDAGAFLDTLDYYEDLEENTETFDITGLRYYCTVHDCGKIVGYVKPEPSNAHDARAQASASARAWWWFRSFYTPGAIPLRKAFTSASR